jgi:signal transduction histidine kinase/CheY-like chemotaxis protein
VAELPVSVQELRDGRNRVSWEVFAIVLERFEEMCGGPEALEAVGYRHQESPAFAFIGRVARLLFSARDLYWMGTLWFGRSLFSIVVDRFEELPGGQVRETLEIPQGYRDSSQFFRCMRGALRAAPHLLGQPDAEVQMELSTHRAVYTITPPPPLTLWARCRRGARAVFDAHATIEELSAQQEQLRRSNEELRAANEQVAAQATRLERINQLGRELTEQIELEAVSDSIVELLQVFQPSRGYALWLHDLGSGQFRLLRRVGGKGPEVLRKLDLQAAGRLVGRLDEWDRASGGPRPADRPEILQELLPWIAIALDNARAYSEIRGQNRLLEAEVVERERAEAERHKLEAQLLQARKLESLGVMAGGIAHDFNNLLVGILGNAHLALMDCVPQSPLFEMIAEIETASRRAAELVRELLAYAGKGQFDVRRSDLSALVDEMLKLLRSRIPPNATIVCKLGEQVPWIEADATQIRQVAMNLITNAAESLEGRPGRVTLRTGVMYAEKAHLRECYLTNDLPDGEYAYLEVQDTGCGMNRETIQRIFDPFYTTKFSGRGLGLAAVIGIVKAHHGTLDVESDLGRGTTFRVLLPHAGPGPQPGEVRRSRVATHVGRGTVLVVEDEAAVRAVSKRMVGKAGFEVLTASGGGEAVALFREHTREIVAVLLDLTMPDMDGETTLRELRRIRADLPVVVCSGHAEAQADRIVQSTQNATFLQKPYTLAALVQSLGEVLPRH